MQRYELVDPHVKKTRYVHQDSVAVLYSMLKESFDDSVDRASEEWTDIHRKRSPHFEFWYKLLELECLRCLCVV